MSLTKIKLIVEGASARAEVDGLLTSGMVGIPIEIHYDSVWDGLTKNLVCKSDLVVKTVLNVENQGTVAHEVMNPNQHLFIGVEGINAEGTLVLPTIWADCGRVEFGANTEDDPSADPTLPVYAQLERKIDDLKLNGGGTIAVTADGDAMIITTTLAMYAVGDAIVIGGA